MWVPIPKLLGHQHLDTQLTAVIILNVTKCYIEAKVQHCLRWAQASLSSHPYCGPPAQVLTTTHSFGPETVPNYM